MIVFEAGNQTIRSSDIMIAKNQAVRSMAIELAAAIAEGTQDMVFDHEPGVVESKTQIEAQFSGLREGTLEYAETVLNDFKDKVLDYIRTMEMTTKVTSIEYHENGELSDFTLNLNVK